MWYMGGKFRQSKAIVANIVPEYEGGAYVEPFVGAFGVAEKIVPALYARGCREFRLSDNSLPVVNMWRAVLFEGWEPPDWVPFEEYRECQLAFRRGEVLPPRPLVGYMGHACAFGGSWFATFARGGAKGRSSEAMQLNQKRALLRKRDAVAPFRRFVSLSHCGYDVLQPKGTLVYCDPPYAERHNPYADRTSFDHDKFWGWCREMAKNNAVFATEFTVPEGAEVLHSWGDTVVRHNNAKPRDGTNEVLVRVLNNG